MAKPQIIDLEYPRGDSFATQFQVVDDDDQPVDITGHTFVMTVDPEPNPPNATNNLFQLSGTIDVAASGLFSVAPSEANTNVALDVYYYDIEMTDPATTKRTIAKGKFTISGDITK